MFPRVRQRLRFVFDRFFCAATPGLRTIGEGSTWCIDTSLLAPGAFVISGGAGKDISFELALARRWGCRILLFDPSPTGIATADAPTNHDPHLTFYPKGLAGRSGDMTFAAPQNPDEGSFTASTIGPAATRFSCVAVSDVLRHHGCKEAALLKLDIEGFEYEVLDDLLKRCGPVFGQIAVEFHHFLPGVSWLSTIKCINALWRAGYKLVHKKQCDYLFMRKDLYSAVRS
jgi:FkbM family methyltransferase